MDDAFSFRSRRCLPGCFQVVIFRVHSIESRPSWLAANLALWLLTVFIFSQSIGLWHLLVARAGSRVVDALPVTISALLAVVTIVVISRHRAAFSWPWAVASTAVFVVGLLSTDPEFPAKRVHLPEYFVLTAIVYWSCHSHMSRRLAVWGGVILSAMLGGVDEIIQGAMATRTFGLRDIAANTLGAFSAGLFLEALNRRSLWGENERTAVPLVAAGLFGYGLLLLAANAHKGVPMPIWVYLPALATLPLLILGGAMKGRHFPEAMGAVCAVALLLLGGINALDIDFR